MNLNFAFISKTETFPSDQKLGISCVKTLKDSFFLNHVIACCLIETKKISCSAVNCGNRFGGNFLCLSGPLN